MRRLTVVLALLFLAACDREQPKPLSEPGERLFPLRGVIVSRNPADNSLRIRHEAVPGFMAAMTMDFRVRGTGVQSLPADGIAIAATLHVTERAFWITNVKRTS